MTVVSNRRTIMPKPKPTGRFHFFSFIKSSLLSENSPRFFYYCCTLLSSIFANSLSVNRRIYFVWQVSRFLRISLKGNFRPDMDTCYVIILPSWIAVLVKFCETALLPRLYSPFSILRFKISMSCWFHCPTGKDISLKFGVLNLNLEII